MQLKLGKSKHKKSWNNTKNVKLNSLGIRFVFKRFSPTWFLKFRRWGVASLLLFGNGLYAQEGIYDPAEAQLLDSVHLQSPVLGDFSVGQWVQSIANELTTMGRPSLGALLNYTTPIYFKENGLGMVASPSFRGTTASQTAVLWNGIPINSNFNGQLDFNTLNAGAYTTIQVRSGGGSLLYGSSAIGGTVHLENHLKFEEKFDNDIYLSHGSYRTWENTYRLTVADEKWSFSGALLQNSSDNDYTFHKREGRNINGEYENYGLDLALGYQINSKNRLYGYAQFYKGDRHFPVFYSSETPTKYRDFNVRTLVEWKAKRKRVQSSLKLAFLNDQYRFYPNIAQESYAFGTTYSFVGRYNLRYAPSPTLLLNTFINHEYTKGEGSDIMTDHRHITAFGVVFRHDLSPRWRYQIGGRKEVTKTYGSPFLYSFGMEYKASGFYMLKLNASKNFRRPTFNDLFWTNAGNKELKAEQSNQIEFGNHFRYGQWRFQLTGYFNDIKDMIHWVPVSGSLFKPVNQDHIQTYGFETFWGWEKDFEDQKIKFNSTYAYTVSKDKRTGRQLIYVPYHKATLAASYTLKRFEVNYQMLYNGRVFLQSDNDLDFTLPGYWVNNMGFSYGIGAHGAFRVGGKIRNLFDISYQNVERYEMPGINFSIFVNIKL